MEQQEETSGAELGLCGRMVRVFTAPERTFEAVGRRTGWTDWFVPMLVVVLAAMIAAQLSMPAIQATQHEFMQERLKTMPPEQREAAVRMGTGSMGTVMTMITIPVSSAIFLFGVAGVLLLVARYGLGGAVTYAQMLAVLGYSSLIGLVALVVRTPLIMAKGTMMVFTGPGVFLPDTALQTFGGRFVAGLDLFVFWQLFVVAVGLATLTRSTTRRALIPLLALWLLWLAGSAALGGLFMPSGQGG
ncbi:MAG: YIP1 family protein [Candidatus Latescibacterota bacterium]